MNGEGKQIAPAILEAVSKGAAVVSVVLIVLLQLGLNRDITWTLRALTALAVVAGWTLPLVAPAYAAAVWLFVAPIAPAVVGRLSHREGPVVDLVWLAGLAATLIRTTNWSRWELPEGWRPLIGGWVLVLSLGWPVIAARELGFDPRLVTDTGAVNSWAMLTAPQVFGWVLYVALTQLLGALWLDAVAGRVARDRKDLVRTVTALCIGVTVSSIVAISQGLVRLDFLSTARWASLNRATGTMMDANAYGVLAAIAAPLAFLAVRLRGQRRAVAIGLGVVAINLAGMWMSASRTALVCAVAGAAGLGAAALLVQQRAARRALPAVLVIAVLAAVLIAAGGRAVGPLGRLRDHLPRSTRSLMASLWTRGGYGTVAVQMVREYPLTGVGIGTYHVIAPDYWHRRTGDTLPFDNAQNWWRHQAAELGLLGGLAIVAWSLLAGAVLLFGRLAPQTRFEAVTLRGVLVGVAAASMLGMPTQSPLVLLTFLLVVAWLSSAILAPDVRITARHPTLAWTLVAVLAVAYAAGHVWLGHRSLSVMSRAVRASREYVVGAYPAEVLPGSNEYHWTRQAATFEWPVRPGVLVLHVWASHPDIERRPVQVRISTPCGVIFDEALGSNGPVEMAFEVAPHDTAVEATVGVSRTWRPADVIRATNDRRTLGAAVWQDWVKPGDVARVQVRPLPPCPAGS